MEFSRYSSWSISGNPDKPRHQNNGGIVRNCNWYIQPDVYLFPDEITPVVGYRQHFPNKPIYAIEDFVQPAQVEDRTYDLYYSGLGLYYYPGARGLSLQLDIAIVQIAYNAADAWVPQTCVLGEQTCSEAFAQFILSTNGNLPLDDINGTRFSSITAIESVGYSEGGYFAQVWNEPPCPPITYYVGFSR
jgi:hypothetical protein